ncbi:hypothetical protein GCM10023321_21650 [Pseudonocardia eucalypti]|uniref:Uncharacterized protein n=1 Tax=Pseudonocardia eucalypti TaxID=648755 RepID=A0ABP9PWF6_9PSEU|nr:hypothetical protein [Pseudonocardia eucalypti]
MAQTSVTRKRPCRQCGGRYYAGHVNPVAALVAVLAFLGGVGMTVMQSGFLRVLSHGGTPPVDRIFTNIHWAVAGVVVAIVVAMVGHRYRCINCDTPR